MKVNAQLSMYTVYLLLNIATGRTYVGYTTSIETRLCQHRLGHGSNATSRDSKSWVLLVALREISNRKTALLLENSWHRPWLVGLAATASTSASAHHLSNRLLVARILIATFGICPTQVTIHNVSPALSDSLHDFLCKIESI